MKYAFMRLHLDFLLKIEEKYPPSLPESGQAFPDWPHRTLLYANIRL